MIVLEWVAGLSIAAWLYLLFLHGFFWRTDVRLPAATANVAPPAAGEWPSIAVIMPARDEAAVLETTLTALLQQRYPGQARVFIVDDRSTDGTGEIADRLASATSQLPLTVINGQDTPPGWSGKLWALQQGITQAQTQRPDFLLLTDADIEHGPGSLVNLVAFAQDRRLDLVSLMARHQATNRWERLIVPAFVYFFSQLYPFRRVNRPRSRTAAAAGGCVLVRPEALERAGGLPGIRGAVIDDVTLAGAVKRQGSPIWLGLADDVTSIRSYDQLADLWNMVARSAFTQLRYSLTLLVLTVAGLGLVYLAPPLCLLIGLVTANPVLAALGAAGWALMTLTFVPMQVYYRQRRLAALLLPVTAGLYLGMTVDSALRHWRGAGVTWKGRRYSPTSTSGA
jgi:hopene-associated glycosyltransferase HpnB